MKKSLKELEKEYRIKKEILELERKEREEEHKKFKKIFKINNFRSDVNIGVIKWKKKMY